MNVFCDIEKQDNETTIESDCGRSVNLTNNTEGNNRQRLETIARKAIKFIGIEDMDVEGLSETELTRIVEHFFVFMEQEQGGNIGKQESIEKQEPIKTSLFNGCVDKNKKGDGKDLSGNTNNTEYKKTESSTPLFI